ncbi:glycoside hydrolase family 9 protein [Flavihumibacter rivuli]|uniref:glycoside hydrolase family 9 protein n=1 Tax=Flavihumibacter rivuli TaxID=2838156 RepID=UPI001BDF243D|nr:glycoside hydrolase family 9 protein [Flavihumibacter rivuli]ULQ57010.1 glycoside hydrolase family 9 protein [Flavihumibacter rivuli]
MSRILLAAYSILLLFATISCGGQDNGGQVLLNQLGFYSYAPKIAIVKERSGSEIFWVVNNGNGDTVFSGKLGPAIQSAYSSMVTRKADFSGLTQSGQFRVVLKGGASSPAFRIGSGIANDLVKVSMKGYYYQRSDIPLLPEHAGKWARPLGHPDDKVLIHASAASAQRPEGTIVASRGGWYDAGDYNKYVVNSGITMGTLLSAYEDFPAYFDSLQWNIPESGNKVPDILDEVIYNLRWLFTMQDPNDGGVYHKCTNPKFDGMIMPDKAKETRYLVQKGTGATLDFVAVMAQASRVLKKFDHALPGLSDSCLKAALYAWQWAEQHPAVEYDQEKNNKSFKPEVVTGRYGDTNFSGEWFWASSELLITTGNQAYLDVLMKWRRAPILVPCWYDVAPMGYFSLLRNARTQGARQLVDAKPFSDELLKLADLLIANGGNKAFGTIMGQSAEDFVWGSNSVAANQGLVLVNAYLYSGNPKYLDAALSNLDYLTGRNATGYCFITGMGSRPPVNAHHRPSVADNNPLPVPGLLVGGPNKYKQDGCKYPHEGAELAYLDEVCSYASNEIAINWNAPLVYVAVAMEALQYRAGWIR